MDKKVKWGVLGTAGIAAGCTIPGMIGTESCELYAIAGRSYDKALTFKERFGFEKAYSGYEALLADPEVEAVYIPLPNDIHCEWVIKALNAHKHVLCEKPIAMNEEELRKMFAAAKENGVILMEAFAYLHSPFITKLRSIVESGEIGKVDYIDTAFVTQGYSEDFRLHKEQGGGGIYDVGCYCTSMILSLIDSPVKYVKADAELDASGVDHLASAMIGFENGARATFNAGMVLVPIPATGMTVYSYTAQMAISVPMQNITVRECFRSQLLLKKKMAKDLHVPRLSKRAQTMLWSLKI
jgi:predicted dehydrogenase